MLGQWLICFSIITYINFIVITKKLTQLYFHATFFYQNIRWCKKVSGDFIVMALQDPPFTTTLSKSKDGCIIVQRSMTYYSVLGSSDDQIMCESGYLESNTICGNGSAYSTLQIPTSDLEEGKG